MSSTKFIARNGLAVGTTPTDIVDSAGTLLVNAPSATKLQTARTISLSGDVVGSVSFDGTGNAAISTTIQPDSVALGTDTTGNYMVNVAAGTGVSVSHVQGEGSTATVSIGQAVGTTDNVTFNSVTVNGTLTSDDITSTNISIAGNATITGNLTVSGTTTTVNSTTIALADANLELARNATTAAQANGAGITVTGPTTPATLTYSSSDDRWNFNKNLNVSTVYGALSGNASTASTWQTARTLSYTGDATGSMSVNGSADVSAVLTLANSGVTAGSYGSGTAIPVLTIDAKGRITAASTSAVTIGNSGLTLSIGTAGATNTTVTIGTGTGFTANATSAYTYDIKVGPALTNLAALMTTAGAGFIKRGATADTYTIDTNTYLTGNQTITISGDASGSGTTSIALTLANSGVTAGTYNNVTVDAKGRVTSGSNVSYLTGTKVDSISATTPIVASASTGAVALSHASSGVTAGTYNNVTVNATGHVTSASNVSYLTSYTETDTLATVTARGASTSTASTFSGGLTSSGGLTITGSTTFNTTTPGTGLYQLNFTGQSTADYAQGITWGWSTNGAQAGVYVQSSGAYGTKMYLATTDSFATGAKTAVTIDHSGNVSLSRGSFSTPTTWINYSTGNYNGYNENIRLYPAGNNVSVIAFGATGISGTPWNSILGFSDRFEIRQGDQWQQRSYANYMIAYGSYRAPIFYDSDDTGTYINPNGSSIINAGSSYPMEFRSSQRYISRFWNTSVAGNGFWLVNDANTLIFHADSVGDKAYLDSSGNFAAYGSARSPIFYDYNDTSYYIDPNSTSSMYRVDAYNFYYRGDTSYGMIGTSGYFDTVNSGYASDPLELIYVRGNEVRVGPNGGDKPIKAAVYYDYADTSYYIDANSTSVMYQINMWGRLAVDNALDYAATAVTGLTSAPLNAYAIYDPSVSTTDRYLPMTHQTAMHSGGYRTHCNTGLFKSTSGWGYNSTGWYAALGGSDSYPTMHWRLTYGVEILNSEGYVAQPNSFRAPIFYDYNDTGYYCDPRSTSRLSGLRLDGVDNNASGEDAILWINKPNNNDWAIITTGAYDYGIDMRMAASHSYALRALRNGTEYYRLGSDLVYHDSNMRAPIFYDYNNTGYYVDPASTTYINVLTTAGNITSNSDIRLKFNITPIVNAIDKVKKLNGVTFNRKDVEDKTKRYTGLIAQDVLEVLPEAVEGETTYSVAYGNMVGLLVEAIKEQQSEIDELKALVKQLLAK